MPDGSPNKYESLVRRLCTSLSVPFVECEDEDEFDEMCNSLLRSIQKLKTEESLPVNEWKLCNDEVPMPEYDMRSPIVSHILSQWSSDANKIMYVISWVECLSSELPEGFPKGLQLAGCNQEVKDGFMLLLIPIIRASSMYPIDVYIRRRLLKNNADQKSNTSIYDLRIKIVVESQEAARSTSIGERFASFPLWSRLGMGDGAVSASSADTGRDSDLGTGASLSAYDKIQSTVAPLMSTFMTKWAELSPFSKPGDGGAHSATSALDAHQGGVDEARSSLEGTPTRRTSSGEGTRALRGTETLMSMYELDAGLSYPAPSFQAPASDNMQAGVLGVSASGVGRGGMRPDPPSYSVIAETTPSSSGAVNGSGGGKKVDRVAERLKALREGK